MNEMKVGRYVVLTDRLYTETDEWVVLSNDNVAVIGITDYAQKKLRDIVGIELPQLQKEVKAGESVGVIESVKAAADIFSPLSGIIVEVNNKLLEHPEIINKDPYGEGWIFKLKASKLSEEKEKLLSPEKYIEKIKGG
ncbi:glycine cleavage system protein GcvH [Saccharolobus solfataricus]|uniref:Probable glycine cleavage system H protein 1 n=3 Tax=Saccharolobus solfataricus TaxID=2287 RepID=GCSH1_SACS2|nr:glycine cleavage system protein GcvH [Saccharolobus solfataricus]Q97ZI6.1 RecName: Full=Probable glycine cleavage system H protein 1 [Saccharolobus solfataricus P2]AAK41202.1 Glycine cleavage system protein H [Saccharolobus solfataricus P2]AKA74154.1 glycine cleavage system protein GcvH [Saccharolobus solfataricus]AKA76852.1 glycine cleavage system protein GcvH [Saccharolobus solfataricus]AKA79545.1 glycine cleavage system protein GcvH [Saccharolobus solfataricus]AZF68633.1 glycine cleavag